MKRVTVGSLKNICVENIPSISLPISKVYPYIALNRIIPNSLPTTISIAGVIEYLSALFSIFDITLGKFV